MPVYLKVPVIPTFCGQDITKSLAFFAELWHEDFHRGGENDCPLLTMSMNIFEGKRHVCNCILVFSL